MQTTRAENPPRRAREARFPFSGLPRGWFVVGLSEDIPREGVTRLRYFGRELVAYRGESGRAYVADAYCPHLGAHLGHGGCVEGETIRCPFHGWRFGPDGRCAAIPYSDKIPPKASIAQWPVVEQDGAVHVFFDADGGAPWPLPSLAEVVGSDRRWTAGKSVLWAGLRTHPQEVFENTVDMAHIGPVHGGRGARVIDRQRDGERLRVDLEFEASGEVVGMPDQINDVHLSVTLSGLGWVVVRTHVRNVGVHALQRIHVTPIDEETVDIRGIVHVAETDDPAFTEELHAIFYRAYVEDFAKDFPIWENKRYLERPMVAPGDGPIGAYRRWCEQFYPRPRERPDVPAARLRSGPSLRAALEPLEEHAQRLVAKLASLVPRRAERRPEPSPESSVPRPAPSAPSASTAPSAPPASAPPGSATRPIASVEEYFATLEERFVPAAAEGLDAVFQWELDGPGGGTYHAHVRDGRLEVRPGPHPSAGVCLAMSADDYVRIINGELDGMRAFTTGRSRLKGSVPLAMKMRSLFPA